MAGFPSLQVLLCAVVIALYGTGANSSPFSAHVLLQTERPTTELGTVQAATIPTYTPTSYTASAGATTTSAPLSTGVSSTYPSSPTQATAYCANANGPSLFAGKIPSYIDSFCHVYKGKSVSFENYVYNRTRLMNTETSDVTTALTFSINWLDDCTGSQIINYSNCKSMLTQILDQCPNPPANAPLAKYPRQGGFIMGERCVVYQIGMNIGSDVPHATPPLPAGAPTRTAFATSTTTNPATITPSSSDAESTGATFIDG